MITRSTKSATAGGATTSTRAVGLNLLAEAANRGLGFLFFVLMARFTGPEVFGDVRAVLSVALIAAGVGVPFLTSVSRRAGQLADNPPFGRSDEHLNYVLADLSAWLAVTILASAATAIAYPPRGASGPAVMLCAIGFACNYFGVLVARSFGRAGVVIGVTGAGNVGQLVLLVLMKRLEPGLLTANNIVLLYGTAFILPPLLTPFLRQFLRVTPEDVRALWRRILSTRGEYLAQFGQHASHILVLNLDLVLLGAVAPPAVLGAYAAAKNLALVALLPANALFHVLIPTATRTNGSDRYLRVFLLGAMTTLALSTTIGLLAQPLTLLLYGDRFAGIATPTRFCIIGATCYAISLLRGAIWVGRGRTAAFSFVVASAALAGAIALWPSARASSPTQAAQVWAYTCVAMLTVIVALDLRRTMIATTDVANKLRRPHPE